MRLASVRVTDYKSIRDSSPFEIGDITCLVGKNESGKTALLEAIYRLNPVVPEHGTFDVTDDYPRSDVEEYQQTVERGKQSPALAIRATFLLEDDDSGGLVEEFGKGVLKTPDLILSKGYGTEVFIEMDLDESVAVKHLVQAAQLPEDLYAEAVNRSTLQELNLFLTSKAQEQEKASSEAMKKTIGIEDAKIKMKVEAEAKAMAESSAAMQLRSTLSAIVKQDLAAHVYRKFLKDRVPKFLYFDEYYQMQGHVNIEQLKARESNNQLTDSDRPMIGLIELARLDLDQLLAPRRTEQLVNKLEGASNHLSNQFLKYWSQNKHLTVKFDVRPARPDDPEGMRTGTNLWGRVHDSVHKVSTLMGTRSKGFVWFFSFLAWFSKQKKREEPLILLLDEPGLSLHAKAQADLLTYIEAELRPHHQVIYTTHSPFMVDPHHFERIRIVEDRSMDADAPLHRENEGTKVFSDALAASEGSLFPLQGALGYDMVQTLFVGANCLVVEGVSDLLYLQVVSGILDRQCRQGLSKEWTITPVGGSDKVPTFVALLGSQKGIKVATLIDIQKKDSQKIENLYKAKLLRKNHVLTFADFTGSSEADIEDMFEVPFYLALVNSEYQAVLNKPLIEANLPTQKRRVIVRIEEHLNAYPLRNDVTFTHYRPARYFADHASDMAPQISEPALQKFESAFAILNKLL